MTKPEKLIVPKEIGEWLDTRDIGNESLMFTLIDELREQVEEEFSGKTREFVFDYKKQLIEVLIGNREYEVEEPEVYAYIKGWEKTATNARFWNYSTKDKELIISTDDEHGGYLTQMTKQEWLEIGIDGTNACFDTELHRFERED